MKRVQAACICQTLHFLLKEDIAHSAAAAWTENNRQARSLWTKSSDRSCALFEGEGRIEWDRAVSFPGPSRWGG